MSDTPLNDDTVHEALQSILETDLDLALGDVTESSLLIDDLGLDSVAFAIGVVAIEERLGVQLTEREIYESKTVGDLEGVIRSKLSSVAS
jgi:acyl carrier protein